MSSNSSSAGSEHRLDGVSEIPPAIRSALAAQWLETAEQVLAIAATPAGFSGLKTLLNLDTAGLNQFLGTLTTVTGPAAAAACRQPTPGGPCGALLTPEQKKRFGLT